MISGNTVNLSTDEKVEQLQKRVTDLENVLNVAKDVMNLEEAALFTGMSKSSLYKLTHRQVIPHYKPNGKLIYFEKTELLNWMRQNRTSSSTEIGEKAQQQLQELANK